MIFLKENKKREHTPPTAEAFNVGGSNSHYLDYNPQYIFFSTERNKKMLEKAKQLASQEFSRLSGREIKAEDCFVVWFSKTLQNWKDSC